MTTSRAELSNNFMWYPEALNKHALLINYTLNILSMKTFANLNMHFAF